MGRWRPAILALASWVCGATGVEAQTSTTGGTRVVRYAEVQPLLAARCLSCHGPATQKSGLRVDRRASLLRGGDSGEPSVMPGDARRSPLIRAVSGDDPDRTMPPKGRRLSAREVALLSAWVDQGAEMPGSPAEDETAPGPDLWSLRPLRPVAPPQLDDPWAANPLDAFVLDRLRRAGLGPSPTADRVTLIRRLHLVLLGLPPTPEEIDRFLADDRPDAYERLVDDALGRPEYGERWAQHWLDVIRWAENWGYETNAERPDAWPYRDWVVRALNADLPFDRFAFAQLAGDTVGDDAATGLLVAGPANLPGQIGKDEPSMRQARQDELDEAVKTVGAALLGLSIGCARCHDHKFDPLSQRDYYAMQAVFAGLRYGPRRLRGPEDDRWAARARVLGDEVALLREQLEARRVALGLRPAVEPDGNAERLAPIRARSVRMAIRATSDGSRPSLFELEVWAAPGDGGPTTENVALATKGARASASSFALENQTRHPDNLIDGLAADGGRFPWTASAPGPAWIQVDLAREAVIDRIVWRRGFEGFPVDYDVAVRRPAGDWVTVAPARDRMLHESDRRPAGQVVLDGVPAAVASELVGLVARVRDAEAQRRRLEAGPQVFAGSFAEAGPTHRLHRGDPMQPREAVAPDIPAALGSLRLPEGSDDAARRVAFARWVAGPDNPLTARVIVNRLWMHHFGDGLVETPSDFGRMGAPPAHPELLDWLAGELIRGGWSLKHVHRLIATSQTFRQAGASRGGSMAAEAGGRLLWRFPPRRLEAEAIRDSILRVSGALNPRMGGPGFDLFHQKGGLADYVPKDSRDPSQWRRMIYATKVRMKPVDVFGAFDCPDAGQMAPRRPRSITPLQALGLLNGEFVNHQAELFAASVRDEAGPDLADQVGRAFRRALGRHPDGDESTLLTALGRRHGLAQVCRVLLNANEFIFLR